MNKKLIIITIIFIVSTSVILVGNNFTSLEKMSKPEDIAIFNLNGEKHIIINGLDDYMVLEDDSITNQIKVVQSNIWKMKEERLNTKVSFSFKDGELSCGNISTINRYIYKTSPFYGYMIFDIEAMVEDLNYTNNLNRRYIILIPSDVKVIDSE